MKTLMVTTQTTRRKWESRTERVTNFQGEEKGARRSNGRTIDDVTLNTGVSSLCAL